MAELHEGVPVDANGAQRLKELLRLALQVQYIVTFPLPPCHPATLPPCHFTIAPSPRERAVLLVTPSARICCMISEHK